MKTYIIYTTRTRNEKTEIERDEIQSDSAPVVGLDKKTKQPLVKDGKLKSVKIGSQKFTNVVGFQEKIEAVKPM